MLTKSRRRSMRRGARPSGASYATTSISGRGFTRRRGASEMRDVVGKACELLRRRLAAGWVVITGDPEAIEIVRDRVYSRHEKEFKLLLPVKYTGGMDIFIAKKREELRRLILSTND
ncbi:MAG: hypothetical protein C0167_00200, partial [Nitrososphaera sp.]